MSTEQVEDYDILYNKGFDDKDTTIEQPQEDSVEEDVRDVEETTDTEEETPEQEEQSPEAEEEETTTDEELYELNYKGEIIKASKSELLELAQKGFDYTSKTQDLAKKRNKLELIEDMDANQLKALVDASKGDKEALSYIAKQAGIDIYELNEDVAYKPQVEEKNYALDDTINMIRSDVKYGETIDKWIAMLPTYVHKEFASDPKLLSDLYTETRNGVAQNVMPEVMKKLAIGSASSFREAYISSRQSIVKSDNKVDKRPRADRETIKKATISKKNVSKHEADHRDIWEDDELYQKMQKMRRGY